MVHYFCAPTHVAAQIFAAPENSAALRRGGYYVQITVSGWLGNGAELFCRNSFFVKLDVICIFTFHWRPFGYNICSFRIFKPTHDLVSVPISTQVQFFQLLLKVMNIKVCSVGSAIANMMYRSYRAAAAACQLCIGSLVLSIWRG